MRARLYLSLRRSWWKLKGYPAARIATLLNESQWWTRDKIENFRDEKLARLIKHCYAHVPYYRRVMEERRLRPVDIQSAADLHKLPLLTKDIVRKHWHELRATNIPDQCVYIASTGGTTGEPMRIAKPFENDAWTTMCYERGLSWGGMTVGTRCVRLTGGSVGGAKKTRWQKSIARFSGSINLLAYDLGENNVQEYARVIRRCGTQFIIGYASNIYLLARLLEERGESLNLRAVFTTAEKLLPKWAATIRKVLNCRVYSYYGCGESNSLGYQCKEGDSYHIPEEHVIMESQSEANGNAFSASRQAIITDLDNYAMPLLRYRNGDLITLDDKQCGCGRALKLISKLEGRTYEFLFAASGELVSAGICDVILGNVESIREFQVRQDATDHLRVLVVPSKKLTDHENAYIGKSFRHYLGESFDVEIRPVDRIPRTRAEKLQTAVNELL